MKMNFFFFWKRLLRWTEALLYLFLPLLVNAGLKACYFFSFYPPFFSPRTHRRASYHCIKEESQNSRPWVHIHSDQRLKAETLRTRMYPLPLSLNVYACLCYEKYTTKQRATKKDGPRVSVKHDILPFSASNKVAAGLGTTIQQHKKHSGHGVSRGLRHEGWWESWGLCCIGPALLYRTTQWSASEGAHCLDSGGQTAAEGWTKIVSQKHKWWAGETTCAHSRILKKGFKMEGV